MTLGATGHFIAGATIRMLYVTVTNSAYLVMIVADLAGTLGVTLTP